MSWGSSSSLLKVLAPDNPVPGVSGSGGPFYLASAISVVEPSAGSTLAQNNFEATVLQHGALGAIIQIAMKGFNQLGLRLRKKYNTTSGQPYNLVITYKLR